MSNESGLAKPLTCTKIAPAAAAMAEPSTNIVMRCRRIGTPSVAATRLWSRPAMTSRCTGLRATKIASNSTSATAHNHTQKIR